MSEAVEAAAALAPVAAAGAELGERERGLAPDVVEALRAADLFRICVPAAYGGGEVTPQELVSAVETLARADASAAWILAVTATSGLLAAYLADDQARAVYGRAGAAVGGTFAPRGLAVLDGGELRVSGRWTFGSGAGFCDWLLGGCLVNGNEMRLVLFPRDRVELFDTWTVSGLRATGSHDFAVDDVVVPAGRSASVAGPPRIERRLYAFPLFGLLALALAGVALGTARGALDELMCLAAGKRPEGSSRLVAERSATQAGVARAEAGLRAAGALLREEIATAWQVAGEHGEIGTDTRVGLRLAATHTTQAAREAVDAAYELGGGSSLYESGPLARRFRDIHAVTQHMLAGAPTWELSGRLLLGLPTDTSRL